MHSLKPYKNRSKGVSDLLDWAALMDDGIVQGKSGAIVNAVRRIPISAEVKFPSFAGQASG
jgi:hypothetical protein